MPEVAVRTVLNNLAVGWIEGNLFEADPLECLKCKGPMRVIALIEDPTVI